MLLNVLTLFPLISIISLIILKDFDKNIMSNQPNDENKKDSKPHVYIYNPLIRLITLIISITSLIVSLIIWILFDSSIINFQFVESQDNISYYDFFLGTDGISIFFLLLTTIITPIAVISNWKSIREKIIYFLSIMLLLETLLLLIFTVLDLLMFYVFFESILAPLFILIGIFGSIEKQRASFYFFLYTFLGSLFMLLSIITISYLSGCTDINIISRNDFVYTTQLFIFLGIFIAFAVKTPVIYLNGWLLKAHVESPLSGSILLAAIVLKLSLYGIFRLILILSPKAYITYTYIIFTIGVITIIYASLSTLRTIDIKELIAYSSVSHAAVYFIGVFSNVIQGIIGSICLGLAHGFVSSGLFIIAGGVLYDRSGTRLISSYKGLAQAMPLLSILFFILCLGNCGAPLTINFVGEFMSLYGVFERLPLAGALASSSIVFSAAFTIYMFNRIIFGGSLFHENWKNYPMDLNLREYSILLILVLFTIFLGIYPSIITDGLNYVTQGLLYSFNTDVYTYNASNNRMSVMHLLNTSSPSPTPEPLAVPRNTPETNIPNPVKINTVWSYIDFRLFSEEGITMSTSSRCVPDISQYYVTYYCKPTPTGWTEIPKTVKFGFVHYVPDCSSVTRNDAPTPWGLIFQDNATPQMQALEELHNNIMFYLAVILFSVTWIMISITVTYKKYKNKMSNKYVNHGTILKSTRLLPVTCKRGFSSSCSRKADPVTTGVVVTATMTSSTITAFFSMLTVTTVLVYGILNDILGSDTLVTAETPDSAADYLIRLTAAANLIFALADNMAHIERNLDFWLNHLPRDEVVAVIRMIGPIALLIDAPNDLTDQFVQVTGLQPIFPATLEWINSLESDPNVPENIVNIVENIVWPSVREAGNSAQVILRACFRSLGQDGGSVQWFE